MTTVLRVTGKEQLAPSLLRVRFHSDDLSAFADSVFTDRYVKLLFPQPGQEDARPTMRTYTALFPDVEQGTLAIDFVLHGDQGFAGPWAAAAEVGDELRVNGPGGAYRPDPTADWHLLVGDESAIPAITAALDELAELVPDARAEVVLQVDSPEHELPLAAPAGARVQYVHRAVTGPEGGLLAAVHALRWPAGRVHAFVHGEAQEVMHGLRPHLLTERGLARDQVSISGYWRRGRSEEGFRDWKAELRQRESQGGADPQ